MALSRIWLLYRSKGGLRIAVPFSKQLFNCERALFRYRSPDSFPAGYSERAVIAVRRKIQLSAPLSDFVEQITLNDRIAAVMSPFETGHLDLL